MRRSPILLTAFSAMFVCGLIYAQDAAEEENPEYDKLKGLQPLIGTWQIEWTNDETGLTSQARVDTSWSETKKMIRQQHLRRTAERGAELSEQEWSNRARHNFVWNHNAERIERVSVSEQTGTIVTSEVKPSEDGVFVMTAIRGTNEVTGGRPLITYKVVKDSFTATWANRTDDAGNPRDDFVYTMQRVKGE